jgi:hypothetical protein
VAELGTMMPELRRPMKAMKRPMPPATAEWSWWGMALSNFWRTPPKVSRRKMMPERKTAPRAVCQGMPMPLTTV